MAWRVTPDVVLYCGAEDDDPVREWMRGTPPATTPGTSCDAADREVVGRQEHHLLVLDDARHLVGIACRHDLARGGTAPVDTQMSTEVFAVAPGTPIGVAATAMKRLRIGCLPVVSGPLVVGYITRSDLARAGLSIEPA
jgi:CBS domain-containing protein